LGQSNYPANQQEVLGFAVPFTSLSKLCKNAGPKPFCCAKPACFDFTSSNFNLQGHILNTSGVALRERMVKQHQYIVLTGEFSADECESSPGRSINLNGGAA
jgi:hypothetical protein